MKISPEIVLDFQNVFHSLHIVIYHLVSELENYYEDYNLHLNAENCLRKKFLNNRPKGYSKSKILSMTTDELLDLDQSLQWYNPSKDESN